MSDYLMGVTVALKGLPTTLYVSVFALIAGIILGLVLAMGKLSKSRPPRIASNAYIEIFRSTPMICQALIMAYGIPMLLQSHDFHFTWSSLVIPATIVCGLNSAAYMAEVFRSGIQAVDPGQIEAAYSLGMTKLQVNRLIILPQAFRIVIPSLVNELVTLVKETSILGYVGVVEVLKSAQLWNASSFKTFQAYVGAAIVYFVVCYPLSKGATYLEKRMKGTDMEVRKPRKGRIDDEEEVA